MLWRLTATCSASAPKTTPNTIDTATRSALQWIWAGACRPRAAKPPPKHKTPPHGGAPRGNGAAPPGGLHQKKSRAGAPPAEGGPAGGGFPPPGPRHSDKQARDRDARCDHERQYG